MKNFGHGTPVGEGRSRVCSSALPGPCQMAAENTENTGDSVLLDDPSSQKPPIGKGYSCFLGIGFRRLHSAETRSRTRPPWGDTVPNAFNDCRWAIDTAAFGKTASPPLNSVALPGFNRFIGDSAELYVCQVRPSRLPHFSNPAFGGVLRLPKVH